VIAGSEASIAKARPGKEYEIINLNHNPHFSRILILNLYDLLLIHLGFAVSPFQKYSTILLQLKNKFTLCRHANAHENCIQHARLHALNSQLYFYHSSSASCIFGSRLVETAQYIILPNLYHTMWAENYVISSCLM
jgi:hypothetical protein